MDTKIIWIGMLVGSTIGSFVPLLWGDGAFSLSGIFTSAAGGFLGIWLAYRMMLD